MAALRAGSEVELAEKRVPPSDASALDRSGLPLALRPPPESPLETANLLSRVLWTWVGRVITAGRLRPLQQNDLDVVPKSDRAEVLHARISKAMLESHARKGGVGKLSVWDGLLGAFGLDYLVIAVWVIVLGVFKIAQPLLLKQLVDYLDRDRGDDWEGYLWALSVGTAGFCYSLSHHQYFFHTMRLGLKTRVALTTLVFRKALTLRASAFFKTTAGQVVTLVSSDAFKLEEGVPYFPYLFFAFVEAAVVLYLLWEEVGPAALVGFASLVLLVPLQSLFAKQFGRIRKTTLRSTEQRVKIMNEMLMGAETVKLYNNESNIRRIVSHNRDKEFASILRASVLRAVNQGLFFSSLAVISFVTFAMFVLTDNAMSPGSVFAVVGLFVVIRLPLTNFVPLSLEKLSESLVSIQRIRNFLNLPELPESSQHRSVDAPPGMLVFENATFRWDAAAVLANVPAADAAASPRRGNRKSSRNDSEGDRTSERQRSTRNDSEGGGGRRGSGAPPLAPPPPTLADINLRVEPGQLVAVVGPIGSSKSSLLAAVLGEIEGTNGRVVVGGRISVAVQKPWIFAATVRDNILFGRAFDRERYSRVLEACQLVEDLELLHSGDQTEIGERGVNLSGGQKARVALARAVYAEADLYLLDDPLSAVDAVVARRIFEQVLGPKGMLANRTRILVTHQTFLLSEVDTVVLLEDGRVRFVGKHDELLARKDLDLGSLLEQAAHSEELKRREEAARKAAVEAAAPLPPPGGQHPPPPPAAHHAVSSSSDGSQSGAVVPLLQPVHRESTEPEERPQPRLLTRGSVAQLTAEADAKREKNIIQEEDRAVGNIGWSVYRDFFRSAHSLLYIVAVTVALVLGQASVVMGDWFLAFWSSKEYDEQQRRWYVGVYAALTGTIIVFALLRAVLFFRLVMSCAYSLHNGMFTGVLYAPMQFFESNPVGRILNRFTKDQSIVDELMPGVFFECVQSVLMVLGALLVVIVVNVYTLIAMVPVCLLFAWVRVQYLASSREIKRLDAVSRSPVYALFSSTLSGLVTVRGFKMSEMVSRDFMSKVDANTRAYLGYLVVVRWLGIRLDIVSLAVVYSTGLFAVFASDSVSAGQVAFSLTYATSLTALLQWAVRQSAELENQMTSVERILAYSRLPPEGERHIPDSLPDPSWPSEGAVEIRSLKLRYRPELDLVLKGLSVSIPPRCKVGVCGRTGAGKSSLFATFFRLVEPCEGTIVIDGVDTRRIGLSDLRSKLAIIPQNPVIYSGSLKYNLDPFNQCSNDQLWDALRAVQLFDMVRALPDGLHTAMAEFGSNFSQGEAQLVCVARALLKPSRILLVDEATASVDGETDRVIQKVLRERFRDRTVITIAHRLNTIMDCDRVLVLDQGQVYEYDAPASLLRKPDGLFLAMARKAGLDVDALLAGMRDGAAAPGAATRSSEAEQKEVELDDEL